MNNTLLLTNIDIFSPIFDNVITWNNITSLTIIK
uniref:Uncharacterized protein n=1 Tax=Medicago truncatula TaxID=3880 RepID=B7FJG8_MEDTR|nr:unknown [Medicago truncatula]